MNLSANGSCFRLSGPEDAPVVTLVHGIGLNHQIWGDFERELSTHFRVLSYDLFGHGESRRPEQALSLSVFAQQLLELIDELEIARTAIVGFSMGGMINRRFAMDFPQRCSALVVLCSPHQRSAAAQQLVETRLSQSSDGGPAATLQSSLERWFSAGFRASEKEKIQQVSDWIVANDPQSFYQSRYILAHGVNELLRPQPPIKQPTLVITCENDSGSTVEMALAIASEIAGSETLIVPKLQHLGMLEAPELFIGPIERFLLSKLV